VTKDPPPDRLERTVEAATGTEEFVEWHSVCGSAVPRMIGKASPPIPAGIERLPGKTGFVEDLE
jgi:hypothetical protein